MDQLFSFATLSKNMPNKSKSISNNSSGKSRQDRDNKRMISAHFDIEAYDLFKIMSSDQGKNTDLLLHEAIAELFKKYKRPIPPTIVKKLRIRGIDV